ncbi:hypothetical protein M8C21_021325 [Ambrosia artemisiifolia]|uniref:Uncharacterized protein n=1 Tax=Ambrosia artemisiifolia TaxID=4212 RepID=A0AAD5G9B1_AMBAR|nr:hypothetical protein M8C21_021325 [Ambrosia artemisiifolia]
MIDVMCATPLHNYGAFLEKDGAGFEGQVTLPGFKNGDVDLIHSSCTYQEVQMGKKSWFSAMKKALSPSTSKTTKTKKVIPA